MAQKIKLSSGIIITAPDGATKEQVLDYISRVSPPDYNVIVTKMKQKREAETASAFGGGAAVRPQTQQVPMIPPPAAQPQQGGQFKTPNVSEAVTGPPVVQSSISPEPSQQPLQTQPINIPQPTPPPTPATAGQAMPMPTIGGAASSGTVTAAIPTEEEEKPKKPEKADIVKQYMQQSLIGRNYVSITKTEAGPAVSDIRFKMKNAEGGDFVLPSKPVALPDGYMHNLAEEFLRDPEGFVKQYDKQLPQELKSFVGRLKKEAEDAVRSYEQGSTAKGELSGSLANLMSSQTASMMLPGGPMLTGLNLAKAALPKEIRDEVDKRIMPQWQKGVENFLSQRDPVQGLEGAMSRTAMSLPSDTAALAAWAMDYRRKAAQTAADALMGIVPNMTNEQRDDVAKAIEYATGATGSIKPEDSEGQIAALREFAAKSDEISREDNMRRDVQSMKDIKDPYDALKWAGATMAEQIPVYATMGAGKAIAGAKGALAAGGLMMGGEFEKQALEETGESGGLATPVVGLVSGYLERLPFWNAVEAAGPETKNIIIREVAKRIGKGVRKGMVEEGLTEGGQQLVSDVASAVLQDKNVIERIKETGGWQYIDQIVGGAVGGAALPAFGKAFGAKEETGLPPVSDEDLGKIPPQKPPEQAPVLERKPPEEGGGAGTVEPDAVKVEAPVVTPDQVITKPERTGPVAPRRDGKPGFGLIPDYVEAVKNAQSKEDLDEILEEAKSPAVGVINVADDGTETIKSKPLRRAIDAKNAQLGGQEAKAPEPTPETPKEPKAAPRQGPQNAYELRQMLRDALIDTTETTPPVPIEQQGRAEKNAAGQVLTNRKGPATVKSPVLGEELPSRSAPTNQPGLVGRPLVKGATDEQLDAAMTIIARRAMSLNEGVDEFIRRRFANVVRGTEDDKRRLRIMMETEGKALPQAAGGGAATGSETKLSPDAYRKIGNYLWSDQNITEARQLLEITGAKNQDPYAAENRELMDRYARRVLARGMSEEGSQNAKKSAFQGKIDAINSYVRRRFHITGYDKPEVKRFFEKAVIEAVEEVESSGISLNKFLDGDTSDENTRKRFDSLVERNLRNYKISYMDALTQGDNLDKDFYGAVEFDDDGRAIIYAFAGSDISTVVHEIGHVFRKDLNETDLAVANRFVGANDNEPWTVDQEEKFARGWERFLRDGKYGDPALDGLFGKFTQWMRDVYGRFIKGTPIEANIPDEMKFVYEKMLTPGAAKTDTKFVRRVNAASKDTDFWEALSDAWTLQDLDDVARIAGESEVRDRLTKRRFFEAVDMKRGQLDEIENPEEPKLKPEFNEVEVPVKSKKKKRSGAKRPSEATDRVADPVDVAKLYFHSQNRGSGDITPLRAASMLDMQASIGPGGEAEMYKLPDGSTIYGIRDTDGEYTVTHRMADGTDGAEYEAGTSDSGAAHAAMKLIAAATNTEIPAIKPRKAPKGPLPSTRERRAGFMPRHLRGGREGSYVEPPDSFDDRIGRRSTSEEDAAAVDMDERAEQIRILRKMQDEGEARVVTESDLSEMVYDPNAKEKRRQPKPPVTVRRLGSGFTIEVSTKEDGGYFVKLVHTDPVGSMTVKKIKVNTVEEANAKAADFPMKEAAKALINRRPRGVLAAKLTEVTEDASTPFFKFNNGSFIGVRKAPGAGKYIVSVSIMSPGQQSYEIGSEFVASDDVYETIGEMISDMQKKGSAYSRALKGLVEAAEIDAIVARIDKSIEITPEIEKIREALLQAIPTATDDGKADETNKRIPAESAARMLGLNVPGGSSANAPSSAVGKIAILTKVAQAIQRLEQRVGAAAPRSRTGATRVLDAKGKVHTSSSVASLISSAKTEEQLRAAVDLAKQLPIDKRAASIAALSRKKKPGLKSLVSELAKSLEEEAESIPKAGAKAANNAVADIRRASRDGRGSPEAVERAVNRAKIAGVIDNSSVKAAIDEDKVAREQRAIDRAKYGTRYEEDTDGNQVVAPAVTLDIEKAVNEPETITDEDAAAADEDVLDEEEYENPDAPPDGVEYEEDTDEAVAEEPPPPPPPVETKPSGKKRRRKAEPPVPGVSDEQWEETKAAARAAMGDKNVSTPSQGTAEPLTDFPSYKKQLQEAGSIEDLKRLYLEFSQNKGLSLAQRAALDSAYNARRKDLTGGGGPRVLGQAAFSQPKSLTDAKRKLRNAATVADIEAIGKALPASLADAQRNDFDAAANERRNEIEVEEARAKLGQLPTDVDSMIKRSMELLDPNTTDIEARAKLLLDDLEKNPIDRPHIDLAIRQNIINALHDPDTPVRYAPYREGQQSSQQGKELPYPMEGDVGAREMQRRAEENARTIARTQAIDPRTQTVPPQPPSMSWLRRASERVLGTEREAKLSRFLKANFVAEGNIIREAYDALIQLRNDMSAAEISGKRGKRDVADAIKSLADAGNDIDVVRKDISRVLDSNMSMKDFTDKYKGFTAQNNAAIDKMQKLLDFQEKTKQTLLAMPWIPKSMKKTISDMPGYQVRAYMRYAMGDSFMPTEADKQAATQVFIDETISSIMKDQKIANDILQEIYDSAPGKATKNKKARQTQLDAAADFLSRPVADVSILSKGGIGKAFTNRLVAMRTIMDEYRANLRAIDTKSLNPDSRIEFMANQEMIAEAANKAIDFYLERDTGQDLGAAYSGEHTPMKNFRHRNLEPIFRALYGEILDPEVRMQQTRIVQQRIMAYYKLHSAVAKYGEGTLWKKADRQAGKGKEPGFSKYIADTAENELKYGALVHAGRTQTGKRGPGVWLSDDYLNYLEEFNRNGFNDKAGKAARMWRSSLGHYRLMLLMTPKGWMRNWLTALTGFAFASGDIAAGGWKPYSKAFVKGNVMMTKALASAAAKMARTTASPVAFLTDKMGMSKDMAEKMLSHEGSTALFTDEELAILEEAARYGYYRMDVSSAVDDIVRSFKAQQGSASGQFQDMTEAMADFYGLLDFPTKHAAWVGRTKYYMDKMQRKGTPVTKEQAKRWAADHVRKMYQNRDEIPHVIKDITKFGIQDFLGYKWDMARIYKNQAAWAIQALKEFHDPAPLLMGAASHAFAAYLTGAGVNALKEAIRGEEDDEEDLTYEQIEALRAMQKSYDAGSPQLSKVFTNKDGERTIGTMIIDGMTAFPIDEFAYYIMQRVGGMQEQEDYGDVAWDMLKDFADEQVKNGAIHDVWVKAMFGKSSKTTSTERGLYDIVSSGFGQGNDVERASDIIVRAAAEVAFGGWPKTIERAVDAWGTERVPARDSYAQLPTKQDVITGLMSLGRYRETKVADVEANLKNRLSLIGANILGNKKQIGTAEGRRISTVPETEPEYEPFDNQLSIDDNRMEAEAIVNAAKMQYQMLGVDPETMRSNLIATIKAATGATDEEANAIVTGTSDMLPSYDPQTKPREKGGPSIAAEDAIRALGLDKKDKLRKADIRRIKGEMMKQGWFKGDKEMLPGERERFAERARDKARRNYSPLDRTLRQIHGKMTGRQDWEEYVESIEEEAVEEDER